tara:strand:- start:54 stop:434 length:381 start_codon:yes stop_codon:yes gene_type:complete
MEKRATYFLNTLRLLGMIPIALLASGVVGVVGNWLGNYGVWIYEGSEILGWVASGAFSLASYFYVAKRISPFESAKIKWLLISVIFVLSLISALSFFISDGLSFVAGVVMFLGCFPYSKLDMKEWP